MAAKQELEILPSLWLGTMNSYLQMKNSMGPEKTEDLLSGWKPMSFKGKVQEIKGWLKNQSIFSEDQMKKLDQGKKNSPGEAAQASTSKNPPQKVLNKDKKAPKSNQNGKKGKVQVEQALPTELHNSREKKQKWTMCSIWSELLLNSKTRRRKE
ncbi:hypothetical protein O181_020099 [Austropuccinia psidii MF-1]|uniref:Uncharacterized protein n=1 Tax=Austropuccinia psidii MF-1 TaxID=1389203 RepID=A0A9Q3GVD4_9BASI|nr:hypothetical protein [Austropuccinia psidii MF-1]